MKRWQFDAPEDKALFDRVLDWLDHRSDKKPFLATLLTVTSHPPFVDPRTGKIDQLGTFRYVDAQLARFYRKLRERHFFDHGVLMITGDHRSMTPLHADEYRRWGERAFARVPMIVVGDVNMPPVVQQSFAQTDVPTSFAWLAGTDTCLDAAHGNFAMPEPHAPDYVLHASGDRPERVNVFFDQKMASIILDGDDSHWQGPQPGDWQHILDSVNLQRIREADIARRHRHAAPEALGSRLALPSARPAQILTFAGRLAGLSGRACGARRLLGRRQGVLDQGSHGHRPHAARYRRDP